MQQGETIALKCPDDGQLLGVKYFPGIEKVGITCPICNKKRLFTEYKIMSKKSSADDPDTEYPDKGKAGQSNNDQTQTDQTQTQAGQTRIEENKGKAIGQLRVQGSKQVYYLKPGNNVVGRMAQTSKATIQLPTQGDRHMSREHVLIEVEQMPHVGYVHYASLCREHCNDTYVNNMKLSYGDKVVLKQGNIIKLPGLNLLFEIPDPEQTDM